METFSALLAICEGNSPVTGEFPSQRPVTRSFDFFFDPRLNKQSSKQSRRRCFETPSHPLWRHCNGQWKFFLIEERNIIGGLWCQKQVSQARISNCIPQCSVGCNYLSLPEIPDSGAKVLIYCQYHGCGLPGDARIKPVHQQPWCWPVSPGIFQSQHQRDDFFYF